MPLSKDDTHTNRESPILDALTVLTAVITSSSMIMHHLRDNGTKAS